MTKPVGGTTMEVADGDVDDSDDLVVTVDDVEALECSICYLPLKPPIFQLKATGRGSCHVCRGAIGGYNSRCHAMERAVESVHVPCPHAVHGCVAKVAYHDRRRHREACPHAPRGCPCGGLAAGSAGALLCHVAGAHIDGEKTRRCWTEVVADRLMAKLKLHVAAAEHGLEVRDIEFVMMHEASVSMDEAVRAMKKRDGDIVKAIKDLRGWIC
ncbi:hypothetical protein HU200_020480 [Digitaria exilis]|uniref:SIAH-type domain-containing protein n=1 Tax=Digitaria exilis TaxID=1010633 RepID=A0A835F1X8_9POAL|nr:hypothetical protein HU200_020480 [Digitaria exilis]